MFSVPRTTISNPFLRAMFRSEEFYSDEVMAQPDQKPRAMARQRHPPAGTAHAAARRLRRNGQHLGQDLLAPPNVKGWDGGLSWITTNTLLSPLQSGLRPGDGAGQPHGRGRRAGPGQAMLAQRANVMARIMQPVNVNRHCHPGRSARTRTLILPPWKNASSTRPLSDRAPPGPARLSGASATDLSDDDIRHAIRLLHVPPLNIK